MSMFELVVAYLRERTRARVLIPLAFMLAFSGWLLVPVTGFDARALFVAVMQAFVLSLAFRVWDDLADRRADRLRHPTRVMARTARTAPFLVLVALLAAAGMTSLLPRSDALARCIAVAIAVTVLSVWYSARRSENWNRVAGGYLVLVKYPLIAFAVAPALPGASGFARSTVVLVSLYAVICIYEYIDDPELRHVFSTWRS